MKKITKDLITNFKEYLVNEEKSKATVEKYIKDVTVFYAWLGERELTKALMLEYKEKLTESYAPASTNSHISSINSFFDFLGWHDCKVKTLKIQRQIFASKEKELAKAEYERLLKAAKDKDNERLYLVMQTICSTGIRVSELKYITWADMKKLCELAKVSKDKVFPHNLRHLFARTYYSLQKDIVRLADILGHSSINTTRIYTIETGDIHRSQIEKLGFLRC